MVCLPTGQAHNWLAACTILASSSTGYCDDHSSCSQTGAKHSGPSKANHLGACTSDGFASLVHLQDGLAVGGPGDGIDLGAPEQQGLQAAASSGTPLARISFGSTASFK
jgi:hypothetical protein